jgi:hypothetical protein
MATPALLRVLLRLPDGKLVELGLDDGTGDGLFRSPFVPSIGDQVGLGEDRVRVVDRLWRYPVSEDGPLVTLVVELVDIVGGPLGDDCGFERFH